MTGFKDTLKLLAAAGFVGVTTLGAHAITEVKLIEDAQAACKPVEVSVYFQPGRSELNEFAEKVLSKAMNQTTHCQLSRVEVFGYADATGDAATNMLISQARAEAALDYLQEHGVEASQIVMQARGEEGAVGPDGKPEVMRRKADLRLIPSQNAA